MSAEPRGCRGYVASRPVDGTRIPQRVQNLVIRDFAHRKGLHFKLSATEYAMPGCFMILDSTLRELPNLEAIILYSLFMLPDSASHRHRIYRRVLEAEAVLYTALEEYRIADVHDVERIEELWAVHHTLRRCPPAAALRAGV